MSRATCCIPFVLTLAVLWPATAASQGSPSQALESQGSESQASADSGTEATNICYGPDNERLEALQAEADRLEAELAALDDAGSTQTTQPIRSAQEAEEELRTKMREARMIRDRDERIRAAAEAIPMAESLYEEHPGVDSLKLLTEIRLMAGRYAEARESAETWVRWRPDDHLAQLYLGQSMIFLDEYELALPPLRRAFDVARDDEERDRAGRNAGFALEKLKRYPEAIAAYQSVGDDTSAERVRLHQEHQELQESSALELGEIDDGTYCPDWRPPEEAQRLEAEMKEFEEADGSN